MIFRVSRHLISGISAVAALSCVHAQTEYNLDGTPTGLEEEIRWHTNRARFDSAAENANRGTAYHDIPATTGPLAPHQSLTTAARRHSTDMATRNIFQHATIPGSAFYNPSTQPDPGSRMKAEGYSWNQYGENLTAGTNRNTGEIAYLSWWNSTGHRDNLMDAGYREIGNGHAFNASSTYRNYLTMKLGRSGNTRFFTDTVFHDANSNGKFEAAEGKSGIEIRVFVNGAAFAHFDRSSPSGSFAVPIQSMASGETVEVSLQNSGNAAATLTIPRSYRDHGTLVLAAGASHPIGSFVTSSTVENVGFRNLTRPTVIPTLTLTRHGGNNFITWPSASQHSYTLQFSTRLPVWQTLTPTPLPGTGNVMQHLHPGAGANPAAFYRLVISY